MLNIPQRKAKATAIAVQTSGVKTISVCWRFSQAASDSSPKYENGFSPVPSKIAP